MLKPGVLGVALSALPLSGVAQEAGEFPSIITSILEDEGRYNINIGTEPVSLPLRHNHLSFGDKFVIPNAIGEFRYSRDDGEGDLSRSFSFSNNDVPQEILSDATSLPDFFVSGDIEATLGYVAERLDLVIPLYSSQNLEVRGGVGLSNYQFHLNGEVYANGETLGYTGEGSAYISASTKGRLINPAIIGELDYKQQYPEGHMFGLFLGGRYEPGNAQVAINMSYDYMIKPNLLMNFSLGGNYQDYYDKLEVFDGFENGWDYDAGIGFTWNSSDAMQLGVNIDNEGEAKIDFTVNAEF